MNVFLYKTPDLNTQGLFTAWSLSSHTPLVSLIETTSGHGLIIRRFGIQVPVDPQEIDPCRPLLTGIISFSRPSHSFLRIKPNHAPHAIFFATMLTQFNY